MKQCVETLRTLYERVPQDELKLKLVPILNGINVYVLHKITDPVACLGKTVARRHHSVDTADAWR